MVDQEALKKDLNVAIVSMRANVYASQKKVQEIQHPEQKEKLLHSLSVLWIELDQLQQVLLHSQ